MKKVERLFTDLGATENTVKEVVVLIDDDNDLNYFYNNILSDKKHWEEMIVEMQDYKLLQQPLMTESDFHNTYIENEREAVEKLFRFIIEEDEWNDVKEIMHMRNFTYSDLYNKQVQNIQQGEIINVWQLIL
ncbi:hypothetical protein [Bacillus manliponensis]|uniref:hypothetical protein n=1 Tax=Bacillus manliponensis TaxID=574376 RepID=UPI0035188E26